MCLSMRTEFRVHRRMNELQKPNLRFSLSYPLRFQVDTIFNGQETLELER